MSSPAYTPSRLRPSQDVARTPLTHSIRKHRGMKAAEERATATEHEHSALSTATDNVQVNIIYPAAQHLLAISYLLRVVQLKDAFSGDCASQALE